MATEPLDFIAPTLIGLVNESFAAVSPKPSRKKIAIATQNTGFLS